jgi:endonuclease-3
MTLFDRSKWKWIPFYLKNHGRLVCTARKPKCGECNIAALCPSALLEPPDANKKSKRKKR